MNTDQELDVLIAEAKDYFDKVHRILEKIMVLEYQSARRRWPTFGKVKHLEKKLLETRRKVLDLITQAVPFTYSARASNQNDLDLRKRKKSLKCLSYLLASIGSLEFYDIADNRDGGYMYEALEHLFPTFEGAPAPFLDAPPEEFDEVAAEGRYIDGVLRDLGMI